MFLLKAQKKKPFVVYVKDVHISTLYIFWGISFFHFCNEDSWAVSKIIWIKRNTTGNITKKNSGEVPIFSWMWNLISLLSILFSNNENFRSCLKIHIKGKRVSLTLNCFFCLQKHRIQKYWTLCSFRIKPLI